MNFLERKIAEMEIKKMLSKISWRTTTWGVLGILATLAQAVYHFHLTGQLDFEGTLKTVSAIAVGAGLIHAADNKNLPSAKALILVCLLALCVHPAIAQDSAPNIYAAGVSFNSNASPQVGGTGLYARVVSDSAGTYALGVIDVLPNTLKPLTVTTIVSPGVAQRVATVGKITLYSLTSAGFSYNADHAGWGWTAGGAASVPLKGKWRAFPNVRVAKSSVSNGTGYQLNIGVLFGRAF